MFYFLQFSVVNNTFYLLKYKVKNTFSKFSWTASHNNITIFCLYHHTGVTATYERTATDVEVIHEDFEIK